MYTTIESRLDAIRNLPIDLLAQRQPMLMQLMADIVNFETEDGKLTISRCLESQDYWQTLDAITKDAGFKRLGNGHFSIAYSHPLLPGKVLKVGLKKEDSGAAYVAFCRMHQGLEGIPVIYDVERYAGCYIVVLDELEPIINANWDIIEPIHDRIFGLVMSAVECSEVAYRERKALHVRALSSQDEALLTTCRMIHEFFKGIAKFDMHCGNAMIDKRTGRIVITDPVSFTVEKPQDLPKPRECKRLPCGNGHIKEFAKVLEGCREMGSVERLTPKGLRMQAHEELSEAILMHQEKARRALVIQHRIALGLPLTIDVAMQARLMG